MYKKKQVGFTLLEAMITVAIMGIILAFAVPSYQALLERNQLKLVVEGLKLDMQFARTQAFKKSQSVVVSRKAGNLGDWCYGLAITSSSKTNCDCKVSDEAASKYCDIKRVMGDVYTKTNLEVATVLNNTFNSRRGTINAGGTTFSSTHYVARIVFSDVGRVRICTPTPLPSGKTELLSQLNC